MFANRFLCPVSRTTLLFDMYSEIGMGTFNVFCMLSFPSTCLLRIKIRRKMPSLKGKVQTVLGLIEPSELGRTMTHEHLTMNFSCCYYAPPSSQEALSNQPIEMKNLFWLKQNPYSNRENLLLCQETDAVKEELLHYKAAGGGTIVENTTTGIQRDMKTLKQLSKETGIHVIAGAGFYVDATHSAETRAMSVEQVRIRI